MERLGSRDPDRSTPGRHTMSKQLYLVIETFKDADPRPVYQRFRAKGRLAPPGLTYISSWVTADLKRCYQLMETDNRYLLDEWMSRWSDLVDFEAHSVISSQEAAEKVAGL